MALVLMLVGMGSEAWAWNCSDIGVPAYSGRGGWILTTDTPQLCTWSKVINDNNMGGQYFCSLEVDFTVLPRNPRGCWGILQMHFNGNTDDHGKSACVDLLGKNAVGTKELGNLKVCNNVTAHAGKKQPK